MSTLDPETVCQFDDLARTGGGRLLDAPCGGGAPAASTGTMSVMAAGESLALDQASPILSALADRIEVVGGTCGLGQAAKLVTQVALAVNLTALVEVLQIAAGYGIGAEAALAAVTASSGGSWASAHWELLSMSMREHNVEVIHKDLRAILGRATERDLFVPVGVAAMNSLRHTWPVK
jgi:3-hydroxyisobutyrate dehydrogenase-like beta-hydroxyacid dehydrogenase